MSFISNHCTVAGHIQLSQLNAFALHEALCNCTFMPTIQLTRSTAIYLHDALRADVHEKYLSGHPGEFDADLVIAEVWIDFLSKMLNGDIDMIDNSCDAHDCEYLGTLLNAELSCVDNDADCMAALRSVRDAIS